MGLRFDNVDIEQEFGVIVDGASSWPKPERDVSYIHVPGRNGDILMDNGCWQNVVISYNLLVKEDWKTAFEDFAAWLCSHVGYFRLEDPDRHPGVYRMASFSSPIDPELWFVTDTGVFTIEFNCKPQQWLTSGETEVLSPYTGMISARASGTTVELVQDTLQNRVTTLIPVSGDVSGYADIETSAIDSPMYITIGIIPYDANKEPLSTVSPIYQTVTIAASTLRQIVNFNFYSDQQVRYIRVYFGTADARTFDNFGGRVDVRSDLGDAEIQAPLRWIDYPLENPTLFPSIPTITMDFDSAVTINDFTVSLSGATYPVVIDCEMETCYHDDGGTLVNMNQYATITNDDPKELKDFPYFKPGTNRVYFGEASLDDVYSDDYVSGTISIVPNWFRI